MAKVMITKERLDTLAQHINAKVGKAGTLTIDQMQETVDSITINKSQAVEWHQCPELSRKFVEKVTYDPSDYSVSSIADYAPTTAAVSNYKPIGKAVGDKTFYNDVPNEQTPFLSGENYGTVKPLDKVRYINTPSAPNVRDLGGWACDGGTVKYGLLFRGGLPTAYDRAVLVDELGIRHDLNLLGAEEAPYTVSPLGDDVHFTRAEHYNWYNPIDNEQWRINLRCVFDAVTHNEPVYFHCAAGADRTGTLACILEGLLGMSQSDIDKDYELTSFYAPMRQRNYAGGNNTPGANWVGLINALNAKDGATFRDKCVTFVAECGFSAEEINAYRAAMIDGTPETVTPSISTFAVDSTIEAGATLDNGTTTVVQYQPYKANIKSKDGYVIESVKVTMGGKDITTAVFQGTKATLNRSVHMITTNCTIEGSKWVIDGQSYVATIIANAEYDLNEETISIMMGGIDVSTFYSGGKISIPKVTGDIVITATFAVSAPHYTNLANTASDDWATGYRFNSNGDLVAQSGDVVTNSIPCTNGNTLRIKGLSLINSSKIIAYSETGTILRIFYPPTDYADSGINTSISGIISTDSNGVQSWTVGMLGDNNTISSTIAYVRIGGTLTGSADDVIITVNEDI